MKKLILATGCDEKYLSKIENYLKSINKNSNFDLNLFIYLSDNIYNVSFWNITTLKMSSDKFLHRTNINCLQHGEFIKSENFDNYVNDNDVIFYTDGDIILQRNLSNDEYEKYKNINHGDVIIGYNESINDNLYNEYIRLLPTQQITPIEKLEYTKIKCYNTGVMGMTKKTWKNLMISYGEKFANIDKMFKYYAKQQWLISYILGTEKYNIIEMGYVEHNHKHFPSPEGTTIDSERQVFYNNKLVLFKHAWEKYK